MPTIPVNDTTLYYDAAGEGEPVVLVCGLSADHRSWGYLFRALAERFHTIRYDHRGIGKSSRGDRPIDSKQLADDLLGLMDALGLDWAHLVGASMGGPIGVIVATSQPERVRSLTLACTTPKIDIEHAALFAELRRLLAEDGIEAYARRVVPLCFSEPYRLAHPEVLDRIVRTLVERPSPSETILEQIDGCVGTDLLDRLSQIDCSTLILDAEADELLSPAGPILLGTIRTARLVTLPGSGHDIFVEHPDQTTRQILNFLGEQ